MGFWRIVGKIFTAPQHLVAKAVEKIGSRLSESFSPILYNTGDFIEKVGKAIDPICYREETATSKDVVDISVVCKDYYIQASEKINNEIQPLIATAENKIDGIKNEIMILVPNTIYEEIKNISAKSKELFEGILKKANDTISEKISISNEEFKEFLSERSDYERKEKCLTYIDKVMQETFDCSKKEILLETNSIISNMILKITEYLDDIEEDLLNAKKEQENFYSKKDDLDIKEQFSKKTVDLAYLNCIISTTDNI